MSYSTTYILAFILIGIVLLYLLSFQPFRSGIKQTIIIPPKTVKKLKSARKQKNEVLVKLDYAQHDEYPIHQKWKTGSSGAVNPGFINKEEVIIHSHPPVRNKSALLNSYETELRERPSFADLQFSKSHKGPELLVTPTNKIIEFNAEQANLSKIRNIEQLAQMKADAKITPTNARTAKQSAALANRIFLHESEKAGVTYREVHPSKTGIKLRTKVK